MRLAVLFAATIMFVSSQATWADTRFDTLAGTVEVLAGATFCNGSGETERQVIQQWVDREIDNERIRTIWRQAIDDRVRFLTSLKDYNCDPVLAQLASFDVGAFRASVAAGAADAAVKPDETAAPAPEASAADIAVLAPYQDGAPWKLIPELPTSFRGFFSGNPALCSVGTREYMARGDTLYWTGDEPQPRLYDAIYLSGKRVAIREGTAIAVLEMLSESEQLRVAQVFTRPINLPESQPTTNVRCSGAQLASYVPHAANVEAASSTDGPLFSLCKMHEDLVDLVFDMHANGARMEDAMSMNGQTFNVNKKLWYFIDRTVEQIYGGQTEDVRQRLQSGRWAEQCSSWLAFA